LPTARRGALVKAIIGRSGFNHLAISPKAQGLMQLMPGTAAEAGADVFSPQENILGGCGICVR
jgi:soluble lytic murein transglycosylase-like protein